MPSAHARRLCPGLHIVSANFDKYRHESRLIRAIFADYTRRIEPLSLDEAYLDVTGSEHHQGSATLIARAIRQRIKSELNLTASAGVAPNKFLAKIASDWDKPDGLFVILPEQIDDFVRALPVARLFGVGKKTAEKLHRMGIYTCEDLRALELLELHRKFGSFGKHLHDLSRGIDDRPVVARQGRKSLSVENTYDRDLETVQDCLTELPDMLQSLKRRVARSGMEIPVNKQFIKLKFSDFSATTVERTSFGIRDDLFRELIEEGFARRDKPVRLMGLGVRFQSPDAASFVQLPLDYEPDME